MSDAIKLGPLPLEVADLYQHLAVFGQTGSGKTRYVLLPLLKEVLALHADDPGRRAGAIIFDVKGDMPDHVTRVMRAAGRTDELIVIGRRGNAWFDPFAQIEADPRRVAERLIEIVENSGASGRSENEAFWRENLRRFIQVASVVARLAGAGQMGGVAGLARAMEMLSSVRSASEEDGEPQGFEGRKKSLEFLAAHVAGLIVDPADAAMARSYIENEITSMAERTWATIANYGLSFASCLRDSDLSSIIGPDDVLPIRFVPEEIFDHGRVVLVSLSRIHFGPMAAVYRQLIKTAFEDAALRRGATVRFDGRQLHPIDQSRPVVFVADEFGSLVTPGRGDDGDAFFLDKAREVSVACLLGMQGVSAVSSRFDQASRCVHLLNNTVTKVFLASDCPETLGYFERCVPHDKKCISASPWIALPGYRHGSVASTSGKPKFTSGDLRLLQTGEGIVLRPQGFAERMQFSQLANE